MSLALTPGDTEGGGGVCLVFVYPNAEQDVTCKKVAVFSHLTLILAVIS